jgi:hypothetical protein
MGKTRIKILQFIRSQERGRLECDHVETAVSKIARQLNLDQNARTAYTRVLYEMVSDHTVVFRDGFLCPTSKSEQRELAQNAKQKNKRSTAPTRQRHRPVNVQALNA